MAYCISHFIREDIRVFERTLENESHFEPKREIQYELWINPIW